MADEIKKIISIDTGDSEQSLKSLRKEINDVKELLQQLTKKGEEYGALLNKLETLQKKLNDAFSMTSKGVEDNTKAFNNLYKSIDDNHNQIKALGDEISKMSKSLNGLGDGVDMSKISSQIEGIKDSLKQSFGEDILGTFNKGISDLKGSINVLEGDINGLKNSFESLNPNSAEFTGNLSKLSDAQSRLNVQLNQTQMNLDDANASYRAITNSTLINQTTTKQLNQGYNQLRTAILDVDVESEEYSHTIEDLGERQGNLNDVIQDMSFEKMIDGTRGIVVGFGDLGEEYEKLATLFKNKPLDTNSLREVSEFIKNIDSTNPNKKIEFVETEKPKMTIKSLKAEIDELRNTILNLEQGTDEYNNAVADLQAKQEKLNHVLSLTKKPASDADNALKKLREQIKQYRNDVLNAEEGTEEWKTAMQNLSNAQFQLRDMNEQARYSVDDLGEQLANLNKIATGVVGGFNAIQGAIVLFGGESENLEKIMVRLQAGIAIVQGMQGLEGMKDSIVGLSNVINSSLLPSIKNVAKSIGKGGWLAIIAVLITTITSLVSVLKENSRQQKLYKKIVDDTKKSLEDYNSELDTSNRQLQRNIEIAKALGKTDEEIAKQRLRFLTQKKEEAYWEFVNASNQLALLKQNSAEYEQQYEYVREWEKTFLELGEQIIDVKNDLAVLFIQAKKAKEELGNVETPEVDLTDNIKIDDGIGKIPDTKFENKTNGATARYDYEVGAKELTLRKKLAEAILLEDEARYDREYTLIEQFNQEKLELINKAIKEETDTELLGSLLLERADLEIEIEENKNLRLAELREQERQQRESDLQMRIMAISTAVQATSSMLGSIADMYESSDKESEKNAKKVKALRIAGATIDTLWGSVMAYMSTMSAFPAPINMVLAPLNAAATLAAGMATIAKIKSSDPIKGGGGSNVSASVEPAQTFSTAMPMTADNQATNLQNIDEMNTDSRVYILESDIQSSNKRVEIRESETTF